MRALIYTIAFSSLIVACGQQQHENTRTSFRGAVAEKKALDAEQRLPSGNAADTYLVGSEDLVGEVKYIESDEFMLPSRTLPPANDKTIPEPESNMAPETPTAPAPVVAAPAPTAPAPTAPAPAAPAPTTPTPAAPTSQPRTYEPSWEIKERLASCNINWQSISWGDGSIIEVRNYRLDANRIRRSTLLVQGNKPEIVFVDIEAKNRIARVELQLSNPYATYCVNVSAGKVINRLEIRHACQAKLGVLNIEAGRRASNVQVGSCL